MIKVTDINDALRAGLLSADVDPFEGSELVVPAPAERETQDEDEGPQLPPFPIGGSETSRPSSPRWRKVWPGFVERTCGT